MPTYEYECPECHGHFEYFQRISDPPKQTCERCGGKLTKLLSGGAGLIFKGSGFYITDYKKSHSSGGEKAAGDGAKSSESKSDGKAAGSETPKTETKVDAAGSKAEKK